MLIIDDSISGKRLNNRKWNWVSFDNTSWLKETNIIYISSPYILFIIVLFIILGSTKYLILILGITIVPRPILGKEVADDSDIKEDEGEWRDPKCMHFPNHWL